MKVRIGEEKKQDVFRDFINTKKRIQIIADENKLSVEDVMHILEEFNARGIFVIRKYERLSSQMEEIIYELRKNGMDYGQISSELGICIEVIATVTKNIFEEKNEEEPLDNFQDKIFSEDEKIYNLRKQKKSYRAIGKEIGISDVSVRNRCKKIFDIRKEEEPRAKNELEKKKCETIYNLRLSQKSYRQIAEETGISQYTAIKGCKEIFEGKGEELPKLSYKNKQTEESKEIDQMIFELVQQGKKYKEVQELLYTRGIILSTERIRQRNERGMITNQKKLANMILNLITTRKATMEQIQQIADYYGVDLERTLNSLEEQTHSLDER